PGDPEIRLVSPTSYLSQPGSASAPGGLVFAATVAMNDVLGFNVLTVDHRDDDPATPEDETDPLTCNDFTYLDRADYDWSFWIGGDPNDELWNGYGGGVGAIPTDSYLDELGVAPAWEFAMADRLHGPAAPDWAPPHQSRTARAAAEVRRRAAPRARPMPA